LIKTIFFDFGNVVAFFDHQRAVRQLTAFTELHAAELTRRLYADALVDDYETGKLTTEQYVSEALRLGQLTCSPDEFLTRFCDIFEANPEVCDLVPKLKPRYRVVLASNTVEPHYDRYVADFAHVFAHFDHLVASHHARARKPHPDFFAYAQRFAGAAPHECLFIDDLAANVETAERFGWKGIVYRPDGSLADKLRDAGVEIGKT
jgi:putative hydrolase of the HAD superfamily